MERLRVQLDDATIRTQQMGALEEQVAMLQEQCERLQGDKTSVEIEMQVCPRELPAMSIKPIACPGCQLQILIVSCTHRIESC